MIVPFRFLRGLLRNLCLSFLISLPIIHFPDFALFLILPAKKDIFQDLAVRLFQADSFLSNPLDKKESAAQYEPES